ncbi:hypothetical protein [uncultured Eubacterium sp.]|uniref:hypothetical protein n=1 Tax=uncultured Eubacterium sp. TaxID=165185 RepID=UPI00259A643F|nr:hypothetical protein [uncultured Eubacterium sp.]
MNNEFDEEYSNENRYSEQKEIYSYEGMANKLSEKVFGRVFWIVIFSIVAYLIQVMDMFVELPLYIPFGGYNLVSYVAGFVFFVIMVNYITRECSEFVQLDYANAESVVFGGTIVIVAVVFLSHGFPWVLLLYFGGINILNLITDISWPIIAYVCLMDYVDTAHGN